MLTSIALGFIGGFYAAQYRGVAYAIFDFQTVLLGLAMITIGGIGKAEGAVLGTLIVIFMRDVLIEWGPWRLSASAWPWARRVVPQQWIFSASASSLAPGVQRSAASGARCAPRRAARCFPRKRRNPEQGRHLFPPLRQDAAVISQTLISPQIIEEHRRQPLGQHSEALERVLLYFRRAKMDDKYALHCAGPNGPYKIIAFSGSRGVSPRLVDDREFATLDEGLSRRLHAPRP